MLFPLQRVMGPLDLNSIFPWLLHIDPQLQPEILPQSTIRPTTPPQQQAKLLRYLPPELILQISFHSNEADTIALALSCKAIYNLLFGNAKKDLNGLLEKAAREIDKRHAEVMMGLGDGLHGRYVNRIMASLERHLPSCYYCARCQKMHTYSQIGPPITRWNQQPEAHRCWLTMVDVPRLNSSGANRGLRLGYHHGRLAMNRHFYGEQTGLPLSFLNSEQVLDYTPTMPLRGMTAKPTWKRSCIFRISQDELILQMNLELSSTNLESLLYVLEQQDYDLCCHVTTAGETCRTQVGGRLRVPNLRNLDFCGLSSFSWGHCNQCVTDYCNYFKCEYEPPFHANKGPTWTVSICGYHLLGDFRHPLDRKWRGFISDRNSILYFENSPWDPMSELMGQWHYTRDMRKYPEGDIRRRWMAAGP